MKRAAAPASTVAGCRLSGVRFAVAIDDVRQLLPFPSERVALPRREGALVGAFLLRDVVVPILDLRRWLPWPGDATADPEAPAQLLVLRQGARWLAVGIDGVDGLHRVCPDAAACLNHGDADDEVFGTVVRLVRSITEPQGTGQALALLDVAALMRLSQVWAQAMACDGRFEPVAATDGRDPAKSAIALTACALLDSEGQLLAVPAAHLRSVVPMPSLQPLWGGDPNRPGLARWRGRDVPVLRLLSTLGMGVAGAAAAPLLAVLEHAGLCIGIPVVAVREVQMLDVAAAQDTAALGVAPGPIVAGILPRPDGGRALLIDVPALVAADPLAALSTLLDEPEAAREHGLQAHIVVQAGTAWALPISALLEIIEVPPAWAASHVAATPWCHTWRERTVPLWDLRALRGHGATMGSADAKVLILQSGSLQIGLVVEALLHLLPARSSELHRIRQPRGQVLPFVVHRDGNEQRSFAMLGTEECTRCVAP